MDDYDFDDPIFDVPEYRYVEFRAIEGRTVYGNVVVYGDITQTRMGRETFAPGAFGDVSQLDTILHMQHERARPLARTFGGGLVLTDSPERLEIAAEMPNTRDGNDALELADRRILRGFSSEFHAKRERFDGGTRIIEAATLPGVGLVDTPQYRQSLITEVRATEDGISGMLPYGKDTVISGAGKVRKQRIQPGAFKFAIDQPDREISLVIGDGSRPLASKQAGSLKLTDTPEGLRFEVKQLPKTSYARDFLALLRAGSIAPGIIPIFSRIPKDVDANADFDEPEKGNPGVFRRVINNGLLSALAILFRPPRGSHGVIQSIFGRRPKRPARSVYTRPRRMIGGVSDGQALVKPRPGDIVRSGRVIRAGQDLGPALRDLWI